MAKSQPVAQGLKKAVEVFAARGGMMRAGEARRLGVHPRDLYKLRDAGEIEVVSRGLYRLAASPPLSDPEMVSIAIRSPRAVICLISALARHGLTTQIPRAIDIALPSHANIPRIDELKLRVFWFSEASYGAGVETTTIDGVPVRIYSIEKTIADCFKYRNKIGLDVAVEALREYGRAKRRPDRGALVKFAKVNRVWRVMQPYLEGML
jgi:predicted transcriptional regulator of viral defense system